jgi:hypothetical protein
MTTEAATTLNQLYHRGLQLRRTLANLADLSNWATDQTLQGQIPNVDTITQYALALERCRAEVDLLVDRALTLGIDPSLVNKAWKGESRFL